MYSDNLLYQSMHLKHTLVIIDEKKRCYSFLSQGLWRLKLWASGILPWRSWWWSYLPQGVLPTPLFPYSMYLSVWKEILGQKLFSWDFFGLYIMMQYDLHVARAPVVDIPIIFEAWLRSRNKWPIIIYTYIVHCSEFNCIYVQKCHSYVQ